MRWFFNANVDQVMAVNMGVFAALVLPTIARYEHEGITWWGALQGFLCLLLIGIAFIAFWQARKLGLKEDVLRDSIH